MNGEVTNIMKGTYYVHSEDNEWHAVKGTSLKGEFPEFDFFLYRYTTENEPEKIFWCVSEARTGTKISFDEDKETAVKKAVQLITEQGVNAVKERITFFENTRGLSPLYRDSS